MVFLILAGLSFLGLVTVDAGIELVIVGRGSSNSHWMQ